MATKTKIAQAIEDAPSVRNNTMLVCLTISLYEGRIKEKELEAEIAVQKGARNAKATSVHKTLFTNFPELEAIKTHRGHARQWINSYSPPWDDTGWRQTPSGVYFNNILPEYNNRWKPVWDDLVDKAVNAYSLAISKQAFELGALFDRSQYLTADEFAQKFKMDLLVRPLPSAGDFRVDMDEENRQVLAAIFEQQKQECEDNYRKDLIERMRKVVERWIERMTACQEHDPDAVEEVKTFDDDGNLVGVDVKKKRRPKLHDSMLEGALELTGIIRDLNVNNDPLIEEGRHMLERALVHVDMPTLKESPEMQQATLNKMKAIKDKFSW